MQRQATPKFFSAAGKHTRKKRARLKNFRVNYDSNGNMITDTGKGVNSITYNHLNLPTTVTSSKGTLSYTYDASGVKLQKTVGSNVTQYAGSFLYKNGSLEMIHTPEGYIEHDNGVFKYVYRLLDHLGNTRVSFQDADQNGAINPENEVIETNDFYPFGLEQQKPGTVIGSTNLGQKFKYNGVELNETLDLYEMPLRQYDPAIGRFTSVDPVVHHEYSTYSAFDNNPVFFADPSGANSTSFIMDLFDRSDDDETWTNNNDGTFSSDKGQEADCDECPSESSDPSNPIEFFNFFLSMFGLGDFNVNDKIISEKLGLEYSQRISIKPQGNAKEWIVKNQDQLLFVGQLAQDVGDTAAVTGYVLTLSGFGSEVGVPLAAGGNFLSTMGSGLEVTVLLTTSDLQGATNEAGWVVAGELIEAAMRKVPGGSPLANQIMRQNGNLKVTLTERVVESKE